MKPRLAVGGLSHESNTYHPELTTLDDFDIYRGGEILSRFAGTNTSIGGMLAAARDVGMDVEPLVCAQAQPSGTLAAASYETVRDELLTRVAAALPVDVIALELHGAGVAEGFDSIEVDLCRCIRRLVGEDVKLVVTLDLHGNLAPELAEVVDIMLGDHSYPHTDRAERGYESVSLVPRLLSGDLRPATHVEYVPMLVGANSITSSGPAATVNELCFRLEQDPAVLDCVFFHGFMWADTPHVGARIVVTTNGDPELAQNLARRAATLLWSLRDEFRCILPEPAEGISQALALEGNPIVLADYADNPGGGAPGDGTHVLRAMLDARLPSACFGFMCDPEVAAFAHGAGVGSQIEVLLGGKRVPLHGAPLPVTAYVKCLTDGRFTYQAMFRGLEEDLGKMARLEVGGIDVLVASRRNQTFDSEVFLLHGIDVKRYKIVALKGSDHFRAGFTNTAKGVVSVDSPGLMSPRSGRFPRQRSPGPLWPLDVDAQYPMIVTAGGTSSPP